MCRDVLYQPVLLVQCLHSFCGHCAKRRLAGRWACPVCHEPPQLVRQNWTLYGKTEAFLRQYPVRERPPREKQYIARFYIRGETLRPPAVAAAPPAAELACNPTPAATPTPVVSSVRARRPVDVEHRQILVSAASHAPFRIHYSPNTQAQHVFLTLNISSLCWIRIASY